MAKSSAPGAVVLTVMTASMRTYSVSSWLPQEEERRASGSAEIGMWLDNLDKFQSMKRKMSVG